MSDNDQLSIDDPVPEDEDLSFGEWVRSLPVPPELPDFMRHRPKRRWPLRDPLPPDPHRDDE